MADYGATFSLSVVGISVNWRLVDGLAIAGDEQLAHPHSHRKTFADSAVNTAIIKTSAATSPPCADHPSPFQIPLSSDTA